MVLSFSANYWYQLWQAQKTKSDSTVQSLICTSDLWTGSAPSHTTTIALLRLWPTTHGNVTPATLPASTQARHSFTAGILQAPEATHGCRVKVSYLLYSAISAAASASLRLSSAPFTMICHFSTQVPLPNFFFKKSTATSCFSHSFKAHLCGCIP